MILKLKKNLNNIEYPKVFRRSFIERPFTFLELMVVIVIVTVMVGVVAPKFSKFYENIKLENNARQLKLFFGYAKNTALATRQDCTVFYIASKHEFQLKIKSVKSVFDGENIQISNYQNDHGESYSSIGGIFRKFQLGRGINLVTAQEMGALPVPRDVNFDFDITPYGIENAYKFTLGNREGESINVVIMAGSGIAKIFKKNTDNYYGD